MPASLSDALVSQSVLSVLNTQWTNTQKPNAVEHGGWICAKPNGPGFDYVGKSKTGTSYCSIILTAPNDLAVMSTLGLIILADFHCHPDLGLASAVPSKADIEGAKALAYKRLVFTLDKLDQLQQYDSRCMPRPTPTGFMTNDVVMWDITYRKIATNG